MFKIGDIITKDNYVAGAVWCNRNGATIKSVKGKLVISKIEQEELSYTDKRKLEYPSIQDQLDMIYWDSVNGTNIWRDKIAEIKAKYPKPDVAISKMETVEKD